MTVDVQPTWREQWEETELRVATPNEQVFMTLRADRFLRVGFAPGYYERTSTVDLQAQLARAARVLFVARVRAFYAAMSRGVGEPMQPGRRSLDAEDRAYHQGLERLSAEGASRDGAVTLTGVGMSHFHVVIAPGTQSRLDAVAFAADCAEAGEAFIADATRKTHQLKFDVHIRPRLDAR